MPPRLPVVTHRRTRTFSAYLAQLRLAPSFDLQAPLSDSVGRKESRGTVNTLGNDVRGGRSQVRYASAHALQVGAHDEGEVMVEERYAQGGFSESCGANGVEREVGEAGPSRPRVFTGKPVEETDQQRTKWRSDKDHAGQLSVSPFSSSTIMNPSWLEPSANVFRRRPEASNHSSRSHQPLYASVHPSPASANPSHIRLQTPLPEPLSILDTRMQHSAEDFAAAYLGSSTSRASGELLRRYANRLDNVAGEREVRDLMGRLRVGPPGYVVPRRKRKMGYGKMRSKPSEAEAVRAVEAEGLENPGHLPEENGHADQDSAGCESQGTETIGCLVDEINDIATLETRNTEPDTPKEQRPLGLRTPAPPVRRKSRRRDKRNQDTSTPNDQGQLVEDPAVRELSPNAHHIGPRRNIRCWRAWPPTARISDLASTDSIMRYLHYAKFHEHDQVPQVAFRDAICAVQRVKGSTYEDLMDVLHLYLAYTGHPDWRALLQEWIEYWQPATQSASSILASSAATSSRRQLGGPLFKRQTLHLCALSIRSSSLPISTKIAGCRSLLSSFASTSFPSSDSMTTRTDQLNSQARSQHPVSPGCETIRHLVQLCLAANDSEWCKSLWHMWWRQYENTYLTQRTRPQQDPSGTSNIIAEKDYGKVRFRFAHRGRTLQRWFRVMRRLERKGWIERACRDGLGTDGDFMGLRHAGYTWTADRSRPAPAMKKTDTGNVAIEDASS